MADATEMAVNMIMTNKHMLFLIILILIPALLSGCNKGFDAASAAVSGDERQSGSNTGIINDTVVDVFKNHDVLSERITQAIFNQPVEIIDKHDTWTMVKTMDGSTGWIKSKYIDTDCSSITADNFKSKIVVTGKTMYVCSQPKGGITIKEIIMGTELYSGYKTDGAYAVTLPKGITGWIQESGTIRVPLESEIPTSTALDFITTAEKFKGTPYMQGGIGAYGIDHAGLIYICGLVNGKNLPRSINLQLEAGKEIELSDIAPGDLIFFHVKWNDAEINDAGIFVRNDRFIHASRVKGHVIESGFDDESFRDRIACIRRLF